MPDKIKEGRGIVAEKSEKVKEGTKDKFWKFKINVTEEENVAVEPKEYPTSFTLWEYPAGIDITVGDTVQMFWTEKPGSYEGKAITYRNINSMAKIEERVGTKLDPAKIERITPREEHGAWFGMVVNQTCEQIRHSEELTFDKHFDAVFDKFWDLFKKKRQEKLGY
jgi:hypothetical protein